MLWDVTHFSAMMRGRSRWENGIFVSISLNCMLFPINNDKLLCLGKCLMSVEANTDDNLILIYRFSFKIYRYL